MDKVEFTTICTLNKLRKGRKFTLLLFQCSGLPGLNRVLRGLKIVCSILHYLDARFSHLERVIYTGGKVDSEIIDMEASLGK